MVSASSQWEWHVIIHGTPYNNSFQYKVNIDTLSLTLLSPWAPLPVRLEREAWGILVCRIVNNDLCVRVCVCVCGCLHGLGGLEEENDNI